MEPSPPPVRPSGQLTPSQQAAVAARGNVLVMAGAGTGKTHTLVQRCLACLRGGKVSLDEMLVVTFTEAAAAEMRQRLRHALEEAPVPGPEEAHLHEQLALFDTAHIGTLHSFCLKLVREHFHQLGLDPDMAVLETGEARLRASETLEEALQTHYAGETPFDLAVQALIQTYGGGRDEKIRALILRLHHYAQARPDAGAWLDRQIELHASPAPLVWQVWLMKAIGDWRDEWRPQLAEWREANARAAELGAILGALPEPFTRAQAAEVLERAQASKEAWTAKDKRALEKTLKPFFADAAFLGSLAKLKAGADPLAEDWEWTRGHVTTLLQLARNFSLGFSRRKLEDGVLDFHDLEQFALKLLWDFPADQPTAVGRRWREKLRFVFVDEYQDINAAQDKIIEALSGEAAAANRFLVGDVKQSIYRFRQGDPKIFREYARRWRGGPGGTLALVENFRSHEGLLNWVNALFEPLMREELGGVNYDAEARLRFGSPETRRHFAVTDDSPARAELLLLRKRTRSELAAAESGEEAGAETVADLDTVEMEARLLTMRLKELKARGHEIWDGAREDFRAVEWRDIAVLLRAPGSKAEVYAREFDRAGIPLVVERGGFYESAEIADLLSVLQLLDNPLQDVPAIAVLRSPLVGLSLDELAHIRLTVAGEPFWTALNRSGSAADGLGEAARRKIGVFLERFGRWRALARQAPLVPCLETVLTETHYLEWLQTRPRGAQRHANVMRLLALAEQFDQFQHQGLHRFLNFTEVQQDAEVEPEVVPVLAENAVRLMSIHQSKGLEFPVVAVADLAKSFNIQDRRADIIFDETYGLCARVKPPQTGRRYPSLPHWLAQREMRREQAGEELRLLYVAVTRARDTLILTGSVTEKKWETQWAGTEPITPQKILAATSYADWIGLWFGQHQPAATGAAGQVPHLSWRLAEETELTGTPAAETGERPEPPVLDDETHHRLQAALTWRYGFTAATEYKAKTSVTALRRQAAELLDDEAQPLFPARAVARWELQGAESGLSAVETGTAHHTLLQHVRLEETTDVRALAAEAERLVAERLLSPEEARVLDLEAVAAFWNSTEGRAIRREAAHVRRELPFTARFRPAELEAISGLPRGTAAAPALADEFVVVQGVADLLVLLPGEIWLVDFKTDGLADGELADKVARYQPQLKLYAGALAKIYGRPVTRCRMHFLAARQTVPV